MAEIVESPHNPQRVVTHLGVALTRNLVGEIGVMIEINQAVDLILPPHVFLVLLEALEDAKQYVTVVDAPPEHDRAVLQQSLAGNYAEIQAKLNTVQ